MANYIEYLKNQGGSISNFELLVTKSIVVIFGSIMILNSIYKGIIGQIVGVILGLLLIIYEEKRRYSKYRKDKNSKGIR